MAIICSVCTICAGAVACIFAFNVYMVLGDGFLERIITEWFAIGNMVQGDGQYKVFLLEYFTKFTTRRLIYLLQ